MSGVQLVLSDLLHSLNYSFLYMDDSNKMRFGQV